MLSNEVVDVANASCLNSLMGALLDVHCVGIHFPTGG